MLKHSACVFTEHIAARFGNEDVESYAVFYVDDDPMDTFTVSMFIRTRRLNGLLLLFSNSTSRYLHVWLDGGKVKVQANDFEILQGHDRVNDGHFHLVGVHLERGTLTLSLSARTQALMASRGLMIRPGDTVHVGGLEDRKASLTFSGYFKGCIQDLRLNFNHLQFYPVSTMLASYRLKTMVQVTQGCTGDNYCRVCVFCLPVYICVCLSGWLVSCLSLCLSVLSVKLYIYLSVYLSVYLPIYLSVYLLVFLSVHASIYQSVFLSVFQSVGLSVYQFVSSFPLIFIGSYVITVTMLWRC